MRHLLVGLFLLLPCGASAAELWTLQGSFSPVKAEEGAVVDKPFVLQAVVDGERIAWTLHEVRRGRWPWTEQFGATQPPALLYDRGDGFSVVPLGSVRIAPERELQLNAEWKEDSLNYRVAGEGLVGDIDCWRVVFSNAYGPKGTLQVAKDSRVVVELNERVVIGRGDDCRLVWKLTERKTLEPQQAERFWRAFGALADLRDKLLPERQQREVKWNDEQLKTLRQQLPELTKQAGDGPLTAVLQLAGHDAETQDSRGVALAALQKQALGKGLSKFELTGSSGEKLTAEELKGAVTVLHFWDYRDTPLEEPYGQVGYLDFLARQRKGVKVYGVMVDDRLEEAGARGGALSSARKVKSFMNLSYPILLDDASVLKQVGDPRTTEAKLPLWVVIGKDGKIAHYHVGFYEVQRDRGLSELDAVVEAASK